MKPANIDEFEIDLWSTSIILNKEHRIRVATSSSNFPRFEVNPNTGDLAPTAEKKLVALATSDPSGHLGCS